MPTSNLPKRRGGHKAYASKLITKIKGEVSPTELQQLREELIRQRDLIIQLNESILETMESDIDIATDIEESSLFIMQINALLAQTSKPTSNSHSQREKPNTVKLPEIKLVKFSGDPLQWQKFYDLFKTAIHDRSDLSNSAKFQYLITQLTGEAAQLLAGFDTTDGEYVEAIDLLKQTYGNSKRLIQSRLHALMDLQSPLCTAKDLGNFRALYEGHLRGLKALGANINEAGYVYAEIILRKLPNKIRDNLNRSHRSDFWSVEDLRREVDLEIGHLQSVNVEDTVEQQEYITPTATFKVTSNEKAIKCFLCSERHATQFCVQFPDSDSRLKKVLSMKLCLNCLRPNHMVKHCNNNFRCRDCKQKHHTVLCDALTRSKNKPSHSRTNVNTNTENGSLVNMVPSRGNVNNVIKGILPTAKVIVKSGDRRCTVNVLFDSGSQNTFIHRELCEKLNLCNSSFSIQQDWL